MPQTERDARIYGISLSETQNSCPLPPLMEWTINLNVQTDNMPYVKRLQGAWSIEHGAADEAAAEPQAQVEVAVEADADAELGSATFTKWLGIASLMPSARETICKRPVKISSLDS